MNPKQLRACAIFEEACGLADGAARRAYVEAHCEGDKSVREEVESLLNAHEGAGSFMKTPGMASGAPLGQPGSGGQQFGDYELLEEIARGGMGVVYKARQVSLNRVVALKMLLTGQWATEAERNRFRTEALAAASLNHRNIIGIYEVGEHRGQPYYAMPLIEGQNLAQLVESGRWVPGDGTEAARLMARIAHAVQYAHDAGIVHRDLKPGNILIDAEGEPRVADFGLAKRVKGEPKLTVTGDVLGTPSFMAPEQARGGASHSTAATDIYSLGAVLYYLLTKRPPFVAESALDALLLVVESEAVLPRRINPLVSGHLEHICLRCLQKRPEARYSAAGELASDLERFLKGESLTVDSRSMGRRFEAWAKRRPALAARVCTVLLCLGIVVTAYWMQDGPRSRHYSVIGVLVFWLVASYLCQWAMGNERRARWVRFVWSGADPAALTAILLIAQSFHSPLVVLYPTLIAASGFWFRVRLVTATTVVSLVGYFVLLLVPGASGPGAVAWHRHLLAVVGIVVTGLTVAYLVNRVSALTRFYENRPPAEY